MSVHWRMDFEGKRMGDIAMSNEEINIQKEIEALLERVTQSHIQAMNDLHEAHKSKQRAAKISHEQDLANVKRKGLIDQKLACQTIEHLRFHKYSTKVDKDDYLIKNLQSAFVDDLRD